MRDARSSQALSQLPQGELPAAEMARLTAPPRSEIPSGQVPQGDTLLREQLLMAGLVSVRESRALGVARTLGLAQQRRAEPLPRAFAGRRSISPRSLLRRLSTQAALDSSVWLRWQVRVKLAMTLRSLEVQEILALESCWEVRPAPVSTDQQDHRGPAHLQSPGPTPGPRDDSPFFSAFPELQTRVLTSV